jgi:hypothetical protein
MPESDADFQELIRRVRANDQTAAAEFVRIYEPAIRRAARIRSVDPRLAPILDSIDVAQSVFTSFFVRAALGQYELEGPKQVLSLLISMSKKKLADLTRRHAALCRDYRRSAPSLTDRLQSAGSDDPGQEVCTQELICEFRNRLTPLERELADRRASGENWGAIGAAKGESGEALRKQFDRAVQRISHDLGLDELVDE